MERISRETVDAALRGAPDAVEELHLLCCDAALAPAVADALFAAFGDHPISARDWLAVIVEMHPELAPQISERLRTKTSEPDI
jgi:hypothetical protein